MGASALDAEAIEIMNTLGVEIQKHEEFEKESIDKFLVQMMQENPTKFTQHTLLLIGKDIHKSNATDFTFSCEADLEEGKRFELKLVGTIKEL